MAIRNPFLLHNRRSNKGFTLLELLIALFVLSIGMLGLAGLQLTSARFGQDAHMRNNITMATTEIIDQMIMRTGKANSACNAASTLPSKCAMVATFAGSGAASNCDPLIGNDPANDIACWKQSLANSLPEGDGTIVDNLDGTVTVTVTWRDRDDPALPMLSTSRTVQLYPAAPAP